MYKGFKHEKIMIIGAGQTILDYEQKIKKIIFDGNFATIGIAKMTNFCDPTYHLWTNSTGYSTRGDCIHPGKSILMLGEKLAVKKDLVRKHYPRKDFITVNFKDEDKYLNKYVFNEKCIKGRFRTAGCLAISIAHIMEAKDILIVGMDGFTLYSKEELLSGAKSHHCFGKGHTDPASWEKCLIKDRIVSESLDSLSKLIKFKIITPTKFSNHYDSTILG